MNPIITLFMFNVPDNLVNFLYLVLGALIYSFAGWQFQSPAPPFDPKKFLRTLILGLIIAYVQYTTGMSLQDAGVAVMANGFYTTAADQIVIFATKFLKSQAAPAGAAPKPAGT